MPRRDVVLTGLIAFGAGVAVGANWPKLRKKVGPLLEKMGLQMADLGDFLSSAGVEGFPAEAMEAEVETRRQRPRAKARKAKVDLTTKDFIPSARRAKAKRKNPRRKPVVFSEEEVPLANGTFGA